MMSPEEHKLVIAMLTWQASMLQAVITALKSHGHLEHDDFQAYLELVTAKPESRQNIFDAVQRYYQDTAQELGLRLEL